jgi:hypothetical protein
MPQITFADQGSKFAMGAPSKYRDRPEFDWAHRMKARDHVSYLMAHKFLDPQKPNSEWGEKTHEGEDWYYHEYQGNFMMITVRTEDNRVKFNHKDIASFDTFLEDTPSANVIFDIRYIDNGTDYVSTCQMSGLAVGLTTAGLVLAGVAFFCVAAFEGFASEGTIAAAILAATGLELNVIIPGAGIILCVLAFIGIFLAYELGRNIEINISVQNRSSQDLKIVNYYFYNISEENIPKTTRDIYQKINDGGVTMKKLHEVKEKGLPFPLDVYDIFDVQIVNYSKYKGIGLALKFIDSADHPITIAIRNDIYHDGRLGVFMNGVSAEAAYSGAGLEYTAPLKHDWGGGVIKITLDPEKFHKYNFAGIISFHSPT